MGEEFVGRVKNIATFGAFIELRDGVDGLLHSSKIQSPLQENDEVRVRVREVKNGKVSLELA